MSLQVGEDLLRSVWDDNDYLASAAVLWDVGDVEEIPDLNSMLKLCRFIAAHKQGRGPTISAFVAPGFGESGMHSVFAGFAPIAGLQLEFFSEAELALAWLAARTLEQE